MKPCKRKARLPDRRQAAMVQMLDFYMIGPLRFKTTLAHIDSVQNFKIAPQRVPAFTPF
jgi:hypothetical protein